MGPAFVAEQREIPVLKTVASKYEGLDAVWTEIDRQLSLGHSAERQSVLLGDRAWHLIQKKRMQGLSREQLRKEILEAINHGHFNLYAYIKKY
jgi:LAO/AO transport system kinase